MAVVDFPTAAPLATKGTESGWVPIEVPPMRGVPFLRLGEVPEGSVLGSRLIVGLERPVPYDLCPDPTVPNAWKLSFRVSPTMSRIVVIDPGHGGRDSGAVDPRNHVPEAELALAIARRLRTELMQRGICAILTRTADLTVDLYHRPYLANEVGAELFLAIHLNMGEPREGGVETYYTHEASKGFASAVQAAVVSVMKRPDRGVKLANFVVTRETTMPSTLAEIGFIDQPDELALMRKDIVQQQLAVSLADAIETTLRAHPSHPQ
jgi:N-acetylmuramoyl-L-alanine amidase